MQILIEKKGIKRKKSLVTFNVLVRMAYRYGLSKSGKRAVIEWMNEPPVKDGNINGFVEQVNRLTSLFPMSSEKFFKVHKQEMDEEEHLESVRNN